MEVEATQTSQEISEAVSEGPQQQPHEVLDPADKTSDDISTDADSEQLTSPYPKPGKNFQMVDEEKSNELLC